MTDAPAHFSGSTQAPVSTPIPSTLKISPATEQTYRLPNPAATTTLAKAFARALNGTETVLISGPMGIGKSFFIRQILRTLGVSDLSIASPTFTLMHTYELTPPSDQPPPPSTAQPNIPTQKNAVHLDLYRLPPGDDRALAELGIVEVLTQAQLVLIEWGESFELLKEHVDYTLVFSFPPDSHQTTSSDPLQHVCSATLKRLR